MTKDRQNRKTAPKSPAPKPAVRAAAAAAPPVARRPIVSSAHLAANSMAELSEFEFALMMANNAFNRWVVRCMNAAGIGDLAALDVLVLHSINHRDRAKRLADICLVLNIEDSHTVNYAVKKLVRTGLVQGEKRGKEIFYSTSAAGHEACLNYRKVREELLIHGVRMLGHPDGDLSHIADIMRALSGIYDQAARAAASL
ncbi:winged helix DNA-binding protein [Ferrovibrio xuzhouensis]|uniref:Winged helix DNA-binding protein n=1 Tax=Ferrovibrio xuzhouensis TaxID=1576914 RepID=A0ABV7VK96_9PROT